MSRRKNKKEQSIYQLLISAIVIICLAVSGYYGTQKVEENKNTDVVIDLHRDAIRR